MMIAPALLVGFAKGILLLVGNGEAGDASVLNTISTALPMPLAVWTTRSRLVYVALPGGI